MKKFKKLFAIIIFVFGFALITTACGKELTSIQVKQGSIELEYVVGEEVDFSNLKIVAKYSDNTTEEITASDLEIGNIDTSTPGQKKVTVKYNDKNIILTIRVFNTTDQISTITGFEEPRFVVDNRTNKSVASSNQTGYFDTTKNYYVGDDNDFVFLPNITALDEEVNEITLNKYGSAVKVYVLNDTNSNKMVDATETWSTEIDTISETKDEDSTYLDSFSTANSTFNFSEEAIGKIVKIEVRPQNQFLDENQADVDSDDYLPSIEFVFEVVNAYNIHTVEQMSVIDNAVGTTPHWASFKTTNNLTNVNPESVVIHGNKIIEADDIPSAYLYKAGDNDIPTPDSPEDSYNTLRCWKSIYTRDTAENKEFNLYGNYFTINVSNVPITTEATLEVEERIESHCALFSFGGDNHYNTNMKQGIVNISELNIYGNQNREEEETYKGAGLSLINSNAKEINITNSIFRKFATFIIAQGTENLDSQRSWGYTSLNLNKIKAYDSFSTMFFLWGVKNTNVENSECIGAGGPIFMLTQVGTDINKNYSNLNVVNSKLEAWVTGNEFWFRQNSAQATATALKALNDPIMAANSNKKSMIKTVNNIEYINFVCVIIDGDNAFMPKQITTKGYANINLDAENPYGMSLYLDEANDSYDQITKFVLENVDIISKIAPIFQTSAGGYMWTDGTSFYPILGFKNAVVNGVLNEVVKQVAGAIKSGIINASSEFSNIGTESERNNLINDYVTDCVEKTAELDRKLSAEEINSTIKVINLLKDITTDSNHPYYNGVITKELLYLLYLRLYNDINAANVSSDYYTRISEVYTGVSGISSIHSPLQLLMAPMSILKTLCNPAISHTEVDLIIGNISDEPSYAPMIPYLQIVRVLVNSESTESEYNGASDIIKQMLESGLIDGIKSQLITNIKSGIIASSNGAVTQENVAGIDAVTNTYNTINSLDESDPRKALLPHLALLKVLMEIPNKDDEENTVTTIVNALISDITTDNALYPYLSLLSILYGEQNLSGKYINNIIINNLQKAIATQLQSTLVESVENEDLKNLIAGIKTQTDAETVIGGIPAAAENQVLIGGLTILKTLLGSVSPATLDGIIESLNAENALVKPLQILRVFVDKNNENYSALVNGIVTQLKSLPEKDSMRESLLPLVSLLSVINNDPSKKYEIIKEIINVLKSQDVNTDAAQAAVDLNTMILGLIEIIFDEENRVNTSASETNFAKGDNLYIYFPVEGGTGARIGILVSYEDVVTE